MYVYDEIDQQIVDARVAQFRDQTRRYLAGELTEDEFRPLRLQNGLYIQRHAPMLRVAIPYGELHSRQIRVLAEVARKYDRDYAHFTTRQNIQYNWPALENVPQILADLATVQMHAVQTSGNCIRNTTSDQFAGVAHDEIIDPRPWCEIIRQWSTFHPEFAHLPRKFKIAVNGAAEDRSAILVHDIGVNVVRNEAGETGFQVYVGGGLGRTPIIGALIKPFLPKEHLLSYFDAVLRVYNRYGRRDNKYKARIKILVKAMTPEAFAAKVEEEWAFLKDGPQTLTQAEIDRVAAFFVDPAYEALPGDDAAFLAAKASNPAFARWVERNVFGHKKPGYACVTLSLKARGIAPGDASDKQLDDVADLADKFSFSEVRVSHDQNLILPYVKQADLFAVWEEAKRIGFATPNVGLLTDVICCPGGDFCSLANAKSIPIALAIEERFDNLDYLHDLGEIELNMSGCMNACGHHHIGNIGILGVDKNGSEWYQVSLGGRQGDAASIGKVIGPSFAQDDMPDVIEKIINVFVENRHGDERFIEVFDRIGMDPFKAKVYPGKVVAKEAV
ncbi:sulfite reductase (NADPH) hemoprotein beta-component [Andreprevotia lacus DSM 23236]|jgi:sulfite reductase (NADPH) hemoprotein beta-component|uniref:Sulfite reductase (NADPH) hemoprotein beta-component n=1 Tax=Andreprevotia lacus DSM 23236 TaxID=1121001 RepID=A0A1W1X972_9NEIS|nr:nitrite/sulfite reductase [Andreprevotia lacus]SMC20439.1 sulfite reductase (NADPH) hemoprotein beta-component [Andreprevotia lacus DSM 23236]